MNNSDSAKIPASEFRHSSRTEQAVDLREYGLETDADAEQFFEMASATPDELPLRFPGHALRKFLVPPHGREREMRVAVQRDFGQSGLQKRLEQVRFRLGQWG